MTSSGPSIQIKPEQAVSEAAALGEKIARGANLFSKLRDDDVAIATTPKDEVWRQDKVSLHRYRPLADKKIVTPVLIVYGLIGRSPASSGRGRKAMAQGSLSGQQADQGRIHDQWAKREAR